MRLQNIIAPAVVVANGHAFARRVLETRGRCRTGMVMVAASGENMEARILQIARQQRALHCRAAILVLIARLTRGNLAATFGMAFRAGLALLGTWFGQTTFRRLSGRFFALFVNALLFVWGIEPLI